MQNSRDRVVHGARKANAGSRAPRAVIVLTLLGTVVATLPIIAAVLGLRGGSPGARTAYASAPAGEYVVVAQAGEEADTVFVAAASGSGSAMEIARIPHLRGYSATGTVSPDGRRLALVVAEGGTPVRPVASLYVLDLGSAAVARVANGVDHLQAAAWARDGRSIYFTRTAESGDPVTRAAVWRVNAGGGSEDEVLSFEGVLGVFVVGPDASGRLVSVVIDSRGSTAYRDGTIAAHLSTQITRDWELSPDGESLAFIESDATSGLRYRAKTVALGEGIATGGVAAQSAGDGQQLGVSWKPGSDAPTFGQEPADADGGVTAQAAASGFDVPLAYSPGGGRLAVQRWTGPSFERPGNVVLELVAEDGSRTPLPEYTRFYGWAVR